MLPVKNLAADMETLTRTILKGTESGLTGIKQILDGQKRVLENE
jgi:hypothetical protein